MQKNKTELKIKYHELVDKFDKKGHKAKVDNFFEIIRGIKIDREARILEIGAGNGLFSHFLAVYFNAKVVSADPYAGEGAPSENMEINQKIAKELAYDKVQVARKNFWDLGETDKFDYIFAINVIHHIIETEKNLSDDQENRRKCLLAFRKIFNMLENGGVFLMRDVEKFNMKKYYGIKTSTVFKLKQNNWEWIRILREAGFGDVKVRHLAPRIIRKLPLSHFFFRFRLVSILVDSAYVIIAKKNEQRNDN